MVMFEVFGDSNIAKCWRAVANEQERLKGSVLRQTTTMASLRDSLKTVAQSTRFVLVSALSNPVSRIKFEGPVMLGQTVINVLDEIFDFLLQTVNANPELKVCFFKTYRHCIHDVSNQERKFLLSALRLLSSRPISSRAYPRCFLAIF
jgi:hypothetical protein